MKIKLLSFLFVLALLAACKEDPDPIIEVSKSTLQAGKLSANFKIDVTSNSEWSAESSQPWCVLSTHTGSQNKQLTITLEPNAGSARTAIVLLKAGKTSQSINIEQSDNYLLPVIFHVLYDNASDDKQYVPAARLSHILDVCNTNYRAKTNPISPDMDLLFTLATEDPNGKELAEAGVEHIQVENSKIDCEVFMNGDLSDNSFYADKLWDPNKYINVFVYTFTEDNTLGISHLPYAPTTSPLNGLYTTDHFSSGQKPNYPHCVSINNTHIYVESDAATYYTSDVTVTLSHELGHYLGLHHAFTEVDEKDATGKVIGTIWDTCQDTDYCEDTPTYNSVEYNKEVNIYLTTTPREQRKLIDLATRKNCEGTAFVARNIMDYAFCYSDQFTNDQRNRINHVLNNSPLIPGADARVVSRSVDDLPVPPIFFKK